MLHQHNRAYIERTPLRALFEPDGMQPAPIPDLPALARRARHRGARPRRPGRVRRLGRALGRKAVMLWHGCPGPWPVKLLLVALAVAEPGPFGELALGALSAANAARKARKAARP